MLIEETSVRKLFYYILIMILLLLLLVGTTVALGMEVVTLEPGKTVNFTCRNYVIQSPNFPNQYGFYEKKGQLIIDAPTEVNAGYYLFFTEFMLSDNEYMTISHDFTSKTFRGAMFPNRGDGAYIYTESGIMFTVGSNSENIDGLAHTGFQIIVQYHGANETVGTKYDDEIDLDAINHAYFFLSPAYPATDSGNFKKKQTFTSKNNIRVLFYDFNFHGTVVLSGTAANGTEVMTKFSGFKTIISTVANYFARNVTIQVLCTFLVECGRYFIIVEPYIPTLETVYTKNITLQSNVLQNFQSYNDTSRLAYQNNLKYSLNITALEYVNQKIMLYLEFESEASSDVMTFTGLVADSELDDWRFTGSWHTILFAETSRLQITFTSDGVGQAAGFKGSSFLQSCSCPRFLILNNSYNITNPGFVGQSYCPGLNCEWSYNFTVNKVLKLDMVSMEFRDHDYLKILDHQNKTIVVISKANKPESSFYADSGVVYFQFTTSSDLRCPPSNNLHFRILSNVINTYEIAKDNIYNNVLNNLTFLQYKFRQSTEIGYLNTLTIKPPFILYDLSTLPNGLFSVYNNGSSFDVLSPNASTGIATYTSIVASSTVQYYNPDYDKRNTIKLLVGQSDQFSSKDCSTPPVISIQFGATYKLNLNAKNEKCTVALFHNMTVLENYALMFSLSYLHNSSNVKIIMGTDSYKFKHVPVYVYGDITTIQYSGSLDTITVNSVVPSTSITVVDNCTPIYITTPDFKNIYIYNIYTYTVSTLTIGHNLTYHFTPLTELEQVLTIKVCTGELCKSFGYSHMLANNAQKFFGSHLTLKFEYAGNSVGLYFSIAACKDAVDTDTKSATINVNLTVSIMFLTILLTFLNNYKSLM